MQITFNLPHVFYPGASSEDNARVLMILLDSLISINQAYLRNHAAKDLYSSGVVYGRTQIWDTIPALYQRGYGDCKSLTAAYIAQQRRKGIECEPVFRWKRVGPHSKRAGNTDYHILVQTEKGFEDPSKVLGMGANENAWFNHKGY